MRKNMQEKVLQINGMSCTGCEMTIERKLRKISGIADVTADYNKGTAEILYDRSIVSIQEITAAIENMGYSTAGASDKVPGAILLIVVLYMVLRHTGALTVFNYFPEAEAGTGYSMLFLIGVLTSVHCIAMCGGISLSQCIPQGAKAEGQRGLAVMKPSLLYNGGRVISYTVIGGIVGALGSVVSFSGRMQGIVQLTAGVFMVIMGLNMLQVFPALRRWNLRMPKAFARRIQKEKNSGSTLYVGLLNGLMPCGPLQAMQLYALSTGSPVKGAVSMLLFSLGTVPLMFAFGALSSLLSGKFTKKAMTAGAVLVIILGVSMFQNGAHLSGVTMRYGNISNSVSRPEIVDGVQVVHTYLNPGSYDPVEVQAGIPVRWIITAEQGAINGCNNRIFVREYGVEKAFEYGENIIEFIPEEAGVFTYSCWMGMISSTITVTE